MQRDKLNATALSWALFSLAYWVAAFFKPFHLDEFYSWVYAKRCSFQEILHLKEFGIGHPPLYHLLQKIVQTVFPVYHPLEVRLVNYLAGSLFILVLVNFLRKYKNVPFFFYGMSISAAVLDIFVYSRMWGLLCLASALLLSIGEKYCVSRKTRDLFLVFAVFGFGFLSDYNFILLIPYGVIVIFLKRHYSKIITFTGSIFLITLWLSIRLIIEHFEITDLLWLPYDRLVEVAKICFETGNVVFGFWFHESFLASLGFFSLVLFLFPAEKKKLLQENQRDNAGEGYIYIIFFILLIALWVLLKYNAIKGKYFLSFMLFAIVSLLMKSRPLKVMEACFDMDRMLLTVMNAMLMLLVFSQCLWRDLLDKRFLLILYPFLIFYIFIVSSKKVLYCVSCILIASGLIYLFSNSVSDNFPAPFFDKGSPVVFWDDASYSTQYLHDGKEKLKTPFIINKTGFKMYCQICEIETKRLRLEDYQKVWFIAEKNFNFSSAVPRGLLLVKEEMNLTALDKLQFKYLTPIYTTRFGIFEYRKSGDKSVDASSRVY